MLSGIWQWCSHLYHNIWKKISSKFLRIPSNFYKRGGKWTLGLPLNAGDRSPVGRALLPKNVLSHTLMQPVSPWGLVLPSLGESNSNWNIPWVVLSICPCWLGSSLHHFLKTLPPGLTRDPLDVCTRLIILHLFYSATIKDLSSLVH